jgi:5-methylcytosine-specific restriction endonuclease McrA
VCPKCRRAVEAVAKAERAVARKTKQVADTDDRAAERAARAVPHTEVCPLCEVEHTYMLMAGYTPRKYCSPAHARRHRGIIAVRATRARKAGAKVVKRVDPLKIFRRDGYVCQACGLPCNRRVPWFHWDAPECDHIIALANGGDHKEENCQTLHRSCNGAKSRQEFRIENVAYATVENIRNMASVGVDERTLSLKFQIPIGAVRGIIGGRIKPKPAPRTPLPVKQAKMRVRKATEPKPVKVPKVRVPRVPKPRKPRVPKADPKQVEIARREMRKAAAAAQVAKRWAKLIAA